MFGCYGYGEEDVVEEMELSLEFVIVVINFDCVN